MELSFSNGADLIEVAALAALHCDALQRNPYLPIRTQVERYWRASKARQVRWAKRLAMIRQTEGASPDGPSFRKFMGLYEEIMASDVLARIWCAMVPKFMAGVCPEIATFTHSALMGQLDARARVLQWIWNAKRLSSTEADACQRIRVGTERWIDLLLGYLGPGCDLELLSCEPQRAWDFVHTFHLGTVGQRQMAEALLIEGISQNAARLFSAKCPHPRWNREVSLSVLVCLGPDLLDATGPWSRFWQCRLDRTASEMQYWLDRIHADEEWQAGVC